MPSANDWDLFQSLHAVLEAGSLSAAARFDIRELFARQPLALRRVAIEEQKQDRERDAGDCAVASRVDVFSSTWRVRGGIQAHTRVQA